jgi:hypothetical protein
MRSQFAMYVDEHLDIKDNPRGSFSLVFRKLERFNQQIVLLVIESWNINVSKWRGRSLCVRRTSNVNEVGPPSR